MFSVMWSEHCSYKSSQAAAADAADRRGEGVVAGPGENAGVVSIGDGLAVAFKIESHNHPSAVEPYQGAATGVGGILRDIFTMGARPDRGARRAAVRRPGDRADAAPRRRRRARRRRLRQLRRRADGRRRARLRPELRGQPARQRDGDRAARGAAAHAGRGAGPGQPRRAVRLDDRPRRHRRRVGPRRATFGDDDPLEAPERPGRRPVRGEAADRGDPRADRARPRRGPPGPRRRRASPARPPRPPTAAAPGSRSTSTRSRGASRAWRRSR